MYAISLINFIFKMRGAITFNRNTLAGNRIAYNKINLKAATFNLILYLDPLS